ncbi:MAG: response regulator transcription factor [Bacteroidales bacterium]|nr:response regulator transcription factor [Bacteroidales bacterium]
MLIDCITIDDEPLALDQMKEYIEKVPYLNLTGFFSSGLKAIDFMKEHKVDLMFLDIQMDDLTGIQLLETITQKPKVILTTAYDQYAIKGYELNISDYLLKPISFERFVKAVNKTYDEITEKKLKTRIVKKPPCTDRNFVFIRADYKMIKVVFSDILFVEGLKDYLKIITAGKTIVTHMNFKTLEQMLPENDFVRVHKSFLVPVSKIDSIGKNSLDIGEHQIPIGDFYKKSFFDAMNSEGLL